MQIQWSDFGLALYVSITEREIILSITKHFSVKCKTLTTLTIFQPFYISTVITRREKVL